LASSGADAKCIIWDLAKIKESQSFEESKVGPPELMFVHGGHVDRISDISWNHNEKLTLASVSQDNVIQVWQMAFDLYYN